MTIKLTDRQQEVLDFVRMYQLKKGYPPTLKEIATHLGLQWTRAIEKHLEALEKKGVLTRERGKGRVIQLPDRSVGRSIPIVGSIAAGRPILAVENITGTFTLDPAIARWDDAFLLKVKGSSMLLAGIFNGDYVLVKPQNDAENGEIVVAMLNDEATVKRLHKSANLVQLKPENPDFQTIEINSGDNFSILGKVVAVIRLLDKSFEISRSFEVKPETVHAGNTKGKK
jgi:repressor LexA